MARLASGPYAKIQRDTRVEGSDGEFARMRHIVVDPRTHALSQIVIGNDLGAWLVPAAEIDAVTEDRVRLRRTSAYYTTLSRFDRDAYHEVHGAVDEEHAGEESREGAMHGGASAPALAGVASAHPYRLQRRDERAHVEAQPEPTGAVLVRRHVVERVETVEVPLREEWLVVERRPGSGRVWYGDRELKEGETIEIPLRRERAVVTRENVGADDVHLRTETRERNERIEVTVHDEGFHADAPPTAARPASTGGGTSERRTLPPPGPLGYYRPEGPRPAPPRRYEDLDDQPTEQIARPAGGPRTDIYDPEPHSAVFGSVAGHENVPVMPPIAPPAYDGPPRARTLRETTMPDTYTGSTPTESTVPDTYSEPTPPKPGRDNPLERAPHGGQTRTGPAANAGELDDVQPGLDPADYGATYVPESDKPASSGEYNPGGGEYTSSPHRGPAGTG